MARALYIHWPFCAKKCPYCDFNSHVRSSVDVDAWRTALIADMRAEHAVAGGETLSSIFFGGGTPSLMPPTLVSDLLSEANRLWGLSPSIEITLEANPSSVEAANFADLAAAGVNRVSLGVQSLDDDTLQWLGRLHGADEAVRALETAQTHFARVSFDLIYALPEQTPEQWEAQLRRAIGFGTSHLSLYQLTVEPGTRFATDVRRGKFSPLADDEAAELYTLTQALTTEAGLPAYEISNHARAGEESRHNLTYWRYHEYCGIGPGAHGRRQRKAIRRHRKPENWLAAVRDQGCGIEEARGQAGFHLTSTEVFVEAILMGMRLTEGVDLQGLEGRFGVRANDILDRDKLLHFINLGLIWQDKGRVGTTVAGRLLLDGLLVELVNSDAVPS